MTNEFGVKLDRNGYAPSIFPKGEDICLICNRRDKALHRHEVFHGTLYRERSKAYGCWVTLCYECHAKLHQKDSALDKGVKQTIQNCAMRHYGWSVDDFRERFGKNYLDE